MHRISAAAPIMLAGLAVWLVGCHQNGANGGTEIASSGAKYCTPFNTTQSVNTLAATDPAAAFEDCAHRWSYTLAPARDSADVVAQAVVDACNTALTRWNERSAGQTSQQGTSDRASANFNGGTSDLTDDRTRYAQSRALFYVVQARAAHCAAPPSATLAAAG